MVDRHRHCVVCGISVSAEKEPSICSRRCEYTMKEKEKKARMSRTLMFMPLIAIMVIFLITALIGSGGLKL